MEEKRPDASIKSTDKNKIHKRDFLEGQHQNRADEYHGKYEAGDGKEKEQS